MSRFASIPRLVQGIAASAVMAVCVVSGAAASGQPITLLDEFGNPAQAPVTAAVLLGLSAMLLFTNRRRRHIG